MNVAVKALAGLRGAIVAAFVAAILLGIFLPIYTDEVGWRFQERAGFDGVDKMFSDVCGPNSLARPPLFMMPVRIASAAVNAAFAAPLWVRLSGIAHALLWSALLLAAIGRIARTRQDRLALGAIGFGLLSLANTPLLLVLSRPEQPVILCAIGAALIALAPPADRTGPARWRALAITLLAAIAVSYHLKALFLLPLFLAAAAWSAHGRDTLAPRVLAIAAIGGIDAVAAQYWVTRLACPADPLLKAEYARNSVGALLGDVHTPAGLWKLAWRLVRNVSMRKYISLATPQPRPLSEWLPNGQITAAASAHWDTAIRAIWLGILACAAVCLAAALWQALRARRLAAAPVLALTLVVAVLGWSATQLTRNFYEAGFVLPLLALAALLAFAAPRTSGALRAVTMLLGGAAAICGLVSIVLTVAIWRPSLLHAWRQHGYVLDQGHSLSVNGFPQVRRDVLALAHDCRIPPPDRAHGVMIDELTYFPYMAAQRPQHWLGVVGIWKGGIADPIGYLESRGSDGLIVGCHLLPPDLAARAHRRGEFCCLAPPGW